MKIHKDNKKDKNDNLPNKIVVPIVYPDERYEKTNTAKPSLANVLQSKEWVEFDKL